MCTCSSSSSSSTGAPARPGRIRVLVSFFFELRKGGVPVTLTEFLTLLEALHARVAWASAEEFYFLARTTLVKDERHYDRFDRVFAEIFHGAQKLFEEIVATVPEEIGRAHV